MKSIVFLSVIALLFSCNEITEKQVVNQVISNSDTAQVEEGNENYNYGIGGEFTEDTIPVMDILSADYPGLYKLAFTLKEAMEKHNENSIIELCDDEHYEIQKGMDINDFQYVYEILNISGRDFKDDDNYKKYCKKNFNDIEKVSFDSFDPLSGAANDEFYFFGTIITSSGEKISFNFTVILTGEDYFITGPVG